MFTLTGTIAYFSNVLAALLKPMIKVSDDTVENVVYLSLLTIIALLLPLVSFDIYLSTVLFVLGWSQIIVNSLRHLRDKKNQRAALISSITFAVFFSLFLAKAIVVNLVSSNFFMYVLITGLVGVAGRLAYLGIIALAKFCFNIDITELLGTSIKNELIAMAKILGLSMADSYLFLLKLVLPPFFFIDLAIKNLLSHDRTFYQIITTQFGHIKQELYDKYKVFIDFVSFIKNYGDPLEILSGSSQHPLASFNEEEFDKRRQAFVILNSYEITSFNRFNKLIDTSDTQTNSNSFKCSLVKQLRSWSWSAASLIHEQQCSHEHSPRPQPA